MCHLVPSLEAGNAFKEALPLVKLLEAEPPRMVSQPLGWEPVRARAVSLLSAIRMKSNINRMLGFKRNGTRMSIGRVGEERASLVPLPPFP
ncbi:hypothetical protein A4S05_02960 [Nostoc sp. KVJ20]|nr:hypothetical protein A4S05_02960 [Nostoc sp. KVJ20]